MEVEKREELVPIFIMGKRYEVAPSITIQKAMEYAGYQLIRGCGCRGGTVSYTHLTLPTTPYV